MLVGLGGALVFYAEHNPSRVHRALVAGKKYRAWRMSVLVHSFLGIECIRLSQSRGIGSLSVSDKAQDTCN